MEILVFIIRLITYLCICVKCAFGNLTINEVCEFIFICNARNPIETKFMPG